MAIVKTAISMPQALFEEANEAAREMKVSRSRLIALALKDYLRKRENDRLLKQMNAAWEDGLDSDEEELLRNMSAYSFRLLDHLEGPW